MSRLVAIIAADDPALRDRSIDEACAGTTSVDLLAEGEALEAFRRASGNLYHRVRALFFLAAIHRYHLPRAIAAERGTAAADRGALIPHAGYEHLLERRFEEAIEA
ncbi:MAG: hypothetical protein EBZ59_00995, partial [Planctomycetia bacterium]|nr:hypothetical protein [Planctomycetia bacterium]